MKRYALGIDYGTLSGRVLLVDLDTGEEIATAVSEYTHSVMDEALPSGRRLGPDWVLQHPQDYLDVLREAVPNVIKKANIHPEQIIGVGIDFTSCTILPTDISGEPLCFKDEYRDNPHAYVKLWKHHAAQGEANDLNRIAVERDEDFLARYGGKISSEWLVPKAWQMLKEAPEVYRAADRIIEAGDWVVWRLTGNEKRSSCAAGYKALWHKKQGYPDSDFFAALDSGLANLTDKLSRDVYPIGSRAGVITAEAARLTGLREGTAVAVGHIDAHVALPAAGIVSPGQMLMIMGTSTCHILLSETESTVPGISGVVEDGVIPGYFAYEAGQACVGDHFDWCMRNCVPAQYTEEAHRQGMDIFQYMTRKAEILKPGQSGLIALDWWNGNRSVLVDADLTGLILGCTLATKPEEIFRALVEATAYGTRMIIDTFEENNVPIRELYACGGIAEKNPMVMQIYADVLDRDIRISDSPQAPALGAAMFGAVAAGAKNGGFDTIVEAARVMAKVREETYKPITAHTEVYNILYREYRTLHDYFGRGANGVMKRLKVLREVVDHSKVMTGGDGWES